MNAERILFPTDFSHYNDAALHFASKLASEANAILYIMHVDDPMAIYPAMGEAAAYYYARETRDDERKEIHDRLSQVLPIVSGIRYEHHYLMGLPVDEILKFAERESIDLIVMATHGRSGLTRLLMGSVAEGVMRKAGCPVLIVKQPAGEKIHETTAETQAMQA
jgi:universal stress protein A